ncbi:MAG TPA: His-Xaa-Ser system radical SAM maturase HxsB [Syntrophales bacterium]|nr:His-Xaa-Ser system radical SAM maturase HxsB [Syntrophales bacterium]
MQKPKAYTIFPFSFSRTSNNEYLLVNEVGEFLFLNDEEFHAFVNQRLDKKSNVFLDLKGKHFATDTDVAPIVDLLATKYRTKKAFLRNFTVLHMVVITARCNHRCRYCHASSESEDALGWDMALDVARKVVDTIFQSPSPTIKIEFQGGEPLLNWKAVREIVLYSEKLNKKMKKSLEFVICTNLTLVDREKLAFIKEHGILISTSLDGPRDLHDKNRVLRIGKSSYALFIDKLNLTRSVLGHENVSALMTTSVESLTRMRDVIDEYIRLGFNGMFLRALNPFGYAKKDITTYSCDDFIKAYKEALSYILQVNQEGTYFEEYYTSLLLTRILTPYCTGFMDLQSPSGAGICGAIYDRNGDVYPSDEGRMLAKMGDRRFKLGNVMRDSYLKIFGGDVLRELTKSSCVETMPGCVSCVYRSYCGADPVRNYVESGHIIGNRPQSFFCSKNIAIFDYLFQLLRKNNENVINVFWSWITKKPLLDLKHVELPRESS